MKNENIGYLSSDTLSEEFERIKPELMSFLTRLVVRPSVAEELVQQTILNALNSRNSASLNLEELRPWLFRIASNLGVDEQRRHGRWRESSLVDAHEAADKSPAFMTTAKSLYGSPEMSYIAREHLAICFSCTLGQLEPEPAVSLLLREVYEFDTKTIAEILDSRYAQVKHWLWSARQYMKKKYDTSCSLINKQGVCYQCVVLDESFNGKRRDPLKGTDGTVNARLNILVELKNQNIGRWTHMVSDLLEEIS